MDVVLSPRLFAVVIAVITGKVRKEQSWAMMFANEIMYQELDWRDCVGEMDVRAGKKTDGDKQ